MFTTHGHHIYGTEIGDSPGVKEKCGGVHICPQCSMEAVTIHNDKINPELKVSEGVKRPAERVDADSFINRLRKAPVWAVIRSEDTEAALELYVIDGENITAYMTPDFLQMTPLRVRVFMARLNNTMHDRDVVRNRLA